MSTRTFTKTFSAFLAACMVLLGSSIYAQTTHTLTINSPAELAGDYIAGIAGFGPAACEVPSFSGELILIDDGTPDFLACDTILNDLTGKIAVISRGACNFSIKVFEAQEKGATAVLIANNNPDGIITMAAGTNAEFITIPSFMIPQSIGVPIISALVEDAVIDVDLNLLTITDPSTATIYWPLTAADSAAAEMSGPLFDIGWTVNDVTCGDASQNGILEGNDFDLWRWDQNGETMGSSCGDNAIVSPSLCNGAAVFASDAYDNNPGNGCGQGGGPCAAAAQIGELISPWVEVDPNNGVAGYAVRFFQQTRQFGSAYFVKFRYGANEPWDSTQINISVNVNTLAEETILNVPLIGSGGQDSIQFAFRYEANYYYWIIDDVKLIEQAGFDLRVDPFFAVAPSYMTPKSQVVPMPFLADVRNVGALDQQNVILNVTIEDEDGDVIHSGDNDYGTLPGNAFVENIPFPGTFTPPATEGQYFGTYSIDAGNPDADSSDNVRTYDFMVTDTVFAKDVGGGNVIAGWNTALWDPGEPQAIALGNYYYVPNGEGFVARTCTFALGNPEELAGQALLFTLYKWDDANDDDQVDPSEREPANGAGQLGTFYFVDGSEGNDLITLSFDEPYELEDDTRYLLMAEWLGDESNPDVQLNMVESDGGVIDYSAMDLASDSLDLPYYQGFFEEIRDQDPTVAVWGPLTTRSFVLRLNVVDATSTSEVLAELPEEVTVFPNPVRNTLTAAYKSEQPMENVVVRIMDMSGRELQAYQYDSLWNQFENYDVSALPSGTYLLNVQSENGVQTKKFLVK